MERDQYYKSCWFRIWNVISEMEQLMELRVELNFSVRVDDWCVEELDIVRSITKPERFRLILPHTMARNMVGQVGGPNVTVLSFMDEEY